MRTEIAESVAYIEIDMLVRQWIRVEVVKQVKLARYKEQVPKVRLAYVFIQN